MVSPSERKTGHSHSVVDHLFCATIEIVPRHRFTDMKVRDGIGFANKPAVLTARHPMPNLARVATV
ncbi:MAG: hypothetical protein A2W31_16390 [Planctomycetes bacterium RBG_16_64_10]|nr:MAG: hypothetical protein A2W31_16390 [Planctomycetes bacterium RBG_16_64_10]